MTIQQRVGKPHEGSAKFLLKCVMKSVGVKVGSGFLSAELVAGQPLSAGKTRQDAASTFNPPPTLFNRPLLKSG